MLERKKNYILGEESNKMKQKKNKKKTSDSEALMAWQHLCSLSFPRWL